MLPKIILLFSAVHWPQYARRPMVYALAESAKKHGSTVVVFDRPLCPFTTPLKQRSRIGELIGKRTINQLADNLYMYNPRYVIHDSIARKLPTLEALNLVALRRSYRGLQKRLKIVEEAPLIWYNYPMQAYTQGLFPDSFVVYELYDHLTDQNGNDSPLMQNLEKQFRDGVDLLLTTSQKIHDRFAEPYRNAMMFGNGLSRRSYNHLSSETTGTWERLNDLPPPILGYAGMVSNRIDWNLVAQLAGRRRDWSFCFVGPINDPTIVERMVPHTNVHLMGPVAYEQIPSVLKSFDIGILPHHDNPFFHYLNPLKFYELAAAGLPTVSSPIAWLDQFPATIVRTTASNPAAWEEVINSMLSVDRGEAGRLGRQIASQWIWEDMTAKLLGQISIIGR
jgi:glycosyltransferase involved in cell wall biosynthesis